MRLTRNVQRGHFLLESGYHSDTWLDVDALFVDAALASRAADALAVSLAGHAIEAVCGPLVGGAFLAQLLASRLESEFYYTEHTEQASTRGLYTARYRIPAPLRARIRDKNVAVVDDVVSAGSAIQATLRDLDDCGAQSTVIAALVTRGQAAARLAAERRIPLERLVAVPINLWQPSDCPLCAEGTPLEPPPS